MDQGCGAPEKKKKENKRNEKGGRERWETGG